MAGYRDPLEAAQHKIRLLEEALAEQARKAKEAPQAGAEGDSDLLLGLRHRVSGLERTLSEVRVELARAQEEAQRGRAEAERPFLAPLSPQRHPPVPSKAQKEQLDPPDEALLKALAEHRKRTRSLLERIRDKEEEVAELRELMKTRCDEIEALRNGLTTKERELEQTEAEGKEMQRRAKERIETLLTYRDAMAGLRTQCEALQRDLAAAHGRIAGLERTLAEVRLELAEAKRRRGEPTR